MFDTNNKNLICTLAIFLVVFGNEFEKLTASQILHLVSMNFKQQKTQTSYFLNSTWCRSGRRRSIHLLTAFGHVQTFLPWKLGTVLAHRADRLWYVVQYEFRHNLRQRWRTLTHARKWNTTRRHNSVKKKLTIFFLLFHPKVTGFDSFVGTV